MHPRTGFAQMVYFQRDLVRKADRTSSDLTFIIAALDTLFKDEDFYTLLRAEKMETLPASIASLVLERRQ